MVEIDYITGSIECRWIFMVELDHFDCIGECVEWQLDTLSHCNKLLRFLLNVVTREGSHWFNKFLELFVSFDIVWLNSGDLHVEEHCGIEKSLLILALQSVKEVILVRVSEHFDSAV